VATLGYRAAKPLHGAPPTFGDFKAGPTTRTPAQVLAHLGNLLDWALHMAQGRQVWNEVQPGAWDHDVARFFTSLKALDAYLAAEPVSEAITERLFQGPIADTLTHVGQLSMLRRLAGAPVRGENYAKATIAAGVLGPEYSTPRFEFD
jgi:hypothetical protein